MRFGARLAPLPYFCSRWSQKHRIRWNVRRNRSLCSLSSESCRTPPRSPNGSRASPLSADAARANEALHDIAEQRVNNIPPYQNLRVLSGRDIVYPRPIIWNTCFPFGGIAPALKNNPILFFFFIEGNIMCFLRYATKTIYKNYLLEYNIIN